MKTQLLSAALIAAALSGCSAKMIVSDLPINSPAGTNVDGIPFRVPKRFTAVVYEKRDAGYVEIARQPVTVADPSHLYVLGFSAGLFSNAVPSVQQNADNTLSEVKLTSTPSGATALTAAGTQINSIATALKAKQTAEKAEETAATAAVTASAGAAISADKAKQVADLAQLQYQTLLLKADTSAEDLLKAQQKLRSSQLDANEAARLARKPPYFPDVIP